MPVHKRYIPGLGHEVVFQHRPKYMAKAKFTPPRIPPVQLPIDWTNNAQCAMPMYGNDQYGDCMYAMAAHCDGAWTYRMGMGTESNFDLTALVNAYKKLSGGDNGLDEGTLVNSWLKDGLAGVPAANIVDSLDIDFTNTALMQFAMDQGFFPCNMWLVPGDFMNSFKTGAVFDQAMTPDPSAGHGTPLIDVFSGEDYRLWTWGTWCQVSLTFLKSVQSSVFVNFSARAFDPLTGLDGKGVHIAQRAQNWTQCGGKPIPASVISAFPPAPAPLIDWFA